MNHTFKGLAASLLAIASLAIATPATATITTYSTLAAFNSAATTNTTVDFSGNSFVGLNAAGGSLWNTNSSSGFSLNGATFSVAGGNHYEAIVAPAFSPSLYDRGTGNQLHAEYSQALTITFDSAITALAFDLSSIFSRSGSVQVGFSNGDSATAILGDPYAFNGFVSSSAFNYIVINGISGDYLMIDNVRFGSNDVPEPGSLALLGLAIAGLAAAKRKHA